MRIFSRYMGVLLLGLIFLLPCLSYGARKKSINVSSYAHLSGTWNYKYTENGAVDKWSVKILGTAKRHGEEIYVAQEYDERGDPNDQQFYLTNMSKGLYWIGGINNYQRVDEKESIINPPVPLLLRTFVPGKKYSYSTHETSAGSVLWTIKIMPASVKVPAGTFRNCYKSTIVITQGKFKETQTYWYCKNKGLVKRIMNGTGGNGIVWELTSYQP